MFYHFQWLNLHQLRQSDAIASPVTSIAQSCFQIISLSSLKENLQPEILILSIFQIICQFHSWRIIQLSIGIIVSKRLKLHSFIFFRCVAEPFRESVLIQLNRIFFIWLHRHYCDFTLPKRCRFFCHLYCIGSFYLGILFVLNMNGILSGWQFFAIIIVIFFCILQIHIESISIIIYFIQAAPFGIYLRCLILIRKFYRIQQYMFLWNACIKFCFPRRHFERCHRSGFLQLCRPGISPVSLIILNTIIKSNIIDSILYSRKCTIRHWNLFHSTVRC